MNDTIGFIYPSCAEGAAGSVFTCMHAGLIPIVSRESGVDVSEDFGIVINELTVDEVKLSIKKISELPTEKLRDMTANAWRHANDNHTKEKYADRYKEIVRNIIKGPKDTNDVASGQTSSNLPPAFGAETRSSPSNI